MLEYHGNLPVKIITYNNIMGSNHSHELEGDFNQGSSADDGPRAP